MQGETLWMLIYSQGKSDLLIPFYASSKESARCKALAWAKKKGVSLKEPITLHHYPRGFYLSYEGLRGGENEPG